MSQTPAHLAARIDRLSRAAHRFHRFAHHPLCHEYAGEVVALGKRTRVCRGCLFSGAGGLAGLFGSAVFAAPFKAVLFTAALGICAFLAAVARRPTGRPRAPKFGSRFLPALAITYSFGSAVQGGTAARALAAALILALFGVVAVYRRRGPDRSPCASCPERNALHPCRGIAPIVRRERAFRRLAGQWLARVSSSRRPYAAR
jgi:hypothetical protein